MKMGGRRIRGVTRGCGRTIDENIFREVVQALGRLKWHASLHRDGVTADMVCVMS